MEVLKNRNGQDRAITRISHSKVRVIGESAFFRTSKDENGNLAMFDFEGGPAFNIGAKFRFEKMDWKVKGIKPEETSMQGLYSVILEVSPIY